MSLDATIWAWAQPVSNPSEKLLLLALADYVNHADPSGMAWPSQATLALKTSLSERTVRNALNGLIEAGLVRRVHRRGGSNSQTSVMYLQFSEVRVFEGIAANARTTNRTAVDAPGQPHAANIAASPSGNGCLIHAATIAAKSGSKSGTLSQGARAREAEHRLPDDWKPDEKDRAYAISVGLSAREIERAEEDFRDYWTSKREKRRGWSGTWRTWVRRARDDRDRRGGEGMAGGARKPGGGGQGASDFASLVVGARRRDP